MNDLRKLAEAFAAQGSRARQSYHVTLGALIDALAAAPAASRLVAGAGVKIVGVRSYRGYYDDIALTTEATGINYSIPGDSDDADLRWSEFPEHPHEQAALLGNMIEAGARLQGYKGGEYPMNRNRPLWVAETWGDASQVAVLGISEDLRLVTRIVE